MEQPSRVLSRDEILRRLSRIERPSVKLRYAKFDLNEMVEFLPLVLMDKNVRTNECFMIVLCPEGYVAVSGANGKILIDVLSLVELAESAGLKGTSPEFLFTELTDPLTQPLVEAEVEWPEEL